MQNGRLWLPGYAHASPSLPFGAKTGGPAMSFAVSRTTGLVKGTVLDVATGKSKMFSGAYLQNWNAGFGMLLGRASVGRVEFRVE